MNPDAVTAQAVELKRYRPAIVTYDNKGNLNSLNWATTFSYETVDEALKDAQKLVAAGTHPKLVVIAVVAEVEVERNYRTRTFNS